MFLAFYSPRTTYPTLPPPSRLGGRVFPVVPVRKAPFLGTAERLQFSYKPFCVALTFGSVRWFFPGLPLAGFSVDLFPSLRFFYFM